MSMPTPLPNIAGHSSIDSDSLNLKNHPDIGNLPSRQQPRPGHGQSSGQAATRVPGNSDRIDLAASSMPNYHDTANQRHLVSVRNQSHKQPGPRDWTSECMALLAACPAPVSSCIVKYMDNTTLTFIGGGNMASSLIGGLIADGWDPARIRVADTDEKQLERLSERFSITTSTDNGKVADHADVIVLAVKPQNMQPVARELADRVARQHPLIISIAAGITETSLRAWLGNETAIVRTMPNTPAMVNSGATALYANPAVNEDQRSIAESILRAVGLAIWIDDESLMDAVTALSGSGPAYFFLFMEAMQSAGCELGLPENAARLLALQTAFGAAKMALESTEDITSLRQRVTSPGGTTEQAINTFQQGNLAALVSKALQAAARRSRELANEFGNDS
jgi:pyrroline-5-carboxylate reductase